MNLTAVLREANALHGRRVISIASTSGLLKIASSDLDSTGQLAWRVSRFCSISEFQTFPAGSSFGSFGV